MQLYRPMIVAYAITFGYHILMNTSTSPEKPEEVEIRAWVRLIRASQDVTGAIERDLKAAGMPPLHWYDVLLELDGAREGRLRPGEIAHQTLFERYSITRLIDRMEKRGLVSRLPCREDARGTLVAITDAGRRLRREMWPVYARAIKRHFAEKLRPGEAEQLARLLSRLVSPRPL